MRASSSLPTLQARETLERTRADTAYVVSGVAHRLGRAELPAARLHRAAERIQPPPRHRMMPLLQRLAELRPEARFVQIGAHDGQQQDPLRDVVLAHPWRGVMVEPVPYVYARLRRNYGHLERRVALENVAIGAEAGPRTFYHLQDTEGAGRPGLPIWFDALGSFRRDVVLNHRRFIPDIEERMVEIEVPCLTFEMLCDRHGIEQLDVLHTDTEGSDWEILESVPFDRFRPTVIIYESVHQVAEVKRACAEHVRGFGYETIEYGLDTWCFHEHTLVTSEARALVPLWRWITDPAREPRQLLPTRLARRAARHLAGTRPDPEFGEILALSDGERHYLEHGHDDRTPLPPGAEAELSAANPRLRELRARYAQLALPAAEHHMWRPESVAGGVDLRWFRGDNLYVWHYPEHPRAMGMKLFVRLRHLLAQGGGPVLERLSEDGAFGAWYVEVPSHGKLTRDRLDAAGELLFLDRRLGILQQDGLRVLDIGAGYGRLAHRLTEAVPGLADVCCVDAVPESTFLSEYYLRLRGCCPPARVLPLDEVTGLQPGSFDLAVNVHSFSECTQVAVQWWAGQLARLRVPHLFVVPNEAEGLLSREADGSTRDLLPTLRAAGYAPIHDEPVIDDPAVRELTLLHDRFHLFALRAGAS